MNEKDCELWEFMALRNLLFARKNHATLLKKKLTKINFKESHSFEYIVKYGNNFFSINSQYNNKVAFNRGQYIVEINEENFQRNYFQKQDFLEKW